MNHPRPNDTILNNSVRRNHARKVLAEEKAAAYLSRPRGGNWYGRRLPALHVNPKRPHRLRFRGGFKGRRSGPATVSPWHRPTERARGRRARASRKANR